MSNPVVRFDIGCKNRDATEAFYSAVFGWSFSDNGPYSRELVAGAEGGMPGSITSLGHEPHQYTMIYIAVTDVGQAMESAVAHGGESVLGPIPIPQGGEFGWVRDPGGNLVAVTDRHDQ